MTRAKARYSKASSGCSFNAVDSKTTASLLSLVRQWHTEQRTVIAVLHDDAQVRAHFPHTLLLAREVVC